MTRPDPEYPSKVDAGIRRWAKEHWAPRPLVLLADTLGIPRITFQHITRADRTLTGDNRVYYALLFLMGISEADPRTIAPIHMQSGKSAPTTKYVAWSEEQWQAWLTTDQARQIIAIRSNEGRIDTPAPPIPATKDHLTEGVTEATLEELHGGSPSMQSAAQGSNRNEWADESYAAFQRHAFSNGCLPHELAEKLGITHQPWHSFRGGSIVKDPSLYARIYLYAGICDPRTIPPRRVYLPKNGQMATSRRNWTEEEWQEWLQSQQAESIRALLKAEGKTSPVIEETSVSQVDKTEAEQLAHHGNILAAQAPSEAPTVDSIIRQIIDQAVSREVDLRITALTENIRKVVKESIEQMAKQLLDNMTHEVTTAFDSSKLQEQLDLLSRISSDLQAAVTQQATVPNAASRDVGIIAAELGNALKQVIASAGNNPQELDKLGRRYGQKLTSLLTLMDPLMLTGADRTNALKVANIIG